MSFSPAALATPSLGMGMGGASSLLDTAGAKGAATNTTASSRPPWRWPPVNETLILYEPPCLLSDAPIAAKKYLPPSRTLESMAAEGPLSPTAAAKGDIPKLNSRKEAHTIRPEDILHQLFPPITWEDNGERWAQTVSLKGSARMDVIGLQEQLDLRCQQRSALIEGICVVREDLFEQCFDELIRQVTLTCAERGVLLARIRDEFRISIEALQTMYTMACQLSMRQNLKLEGKRAIIPQLKQMEGDIVGAEKQVNELKAKYEAIEKREIERRQADEIRHKEEVAFLKKGNMQLTNEIKRYMA